ncbi:MAG: hypothetical protein HFJ52_08675 [Clostridia bacterium]|nr:hypothetical protein [Clostridia bacterium]
MEKQKQSTEEKIDIILSQVLTLQGQMTIMQGQMKTMQGQMNTMEERLEEKMNKKFVEFKEELDKSIDQKLDQRFTEFKRDLGTFLGGIFQEAEDKIDKNEREIKKLPCVSFKTRLKKFVSKTN